MIFLVLVVIIMIALLGILGWVVFRQPVEKYCGTTGFMYGEVDELPDNIMRESKSPPFYSLDAPRAPLCAYKNYMMPPPLRPPPTNCPDNATPLQYWNIATLSHPQTPYLI